MCGVCELRGVGSVSGGAVISWRPT